MELTQELIDRFMKVAPAQIGHYIKSGYMHPRIKPVSKNFKMIGPAVTVRMIGTSNTMLYYAQEHSPKGSVIVVDRGAQDTHACCGDGCSLSALVNGMAGIVIDGPNCDSSGIVEVGLPVFSTGGSVVTCMATPDPQAEYNVPVSCGDTIVNPGDIVFGDEDGVLVMKPEDCVRLLELAEAGDRLELEPGGLVESLRNGTKKMSDYAPIIHDALKIAGIEE